MGEKKKRKGQLPSGNFRKQVMVNGIRYSLTFDHNPTKKEIQEELDRRTHNRLSNRHLTFKRASEEYNELKEGSLKDATIREYDRMCKRLPAWFVNMDIGDIDDIVIQRVIKELSQKVSAKTVKDRYAYITSVLRLYEPNLAFNVSLPTIVPKEPYLPTHDEIKTLIDGSIGTQYHIALQLAKYGLRREEICALMVEDLIIDDGDYFVNINKALTQDKNNKWNVTITKTLDSVRIVPIDKELGEEILALGEGNVYKGFPEAIATYIRRQQTKLGMEKFSLHKFRHYFASTLAENNVPEADILYVGGWKKNSDVMKRIYRQSNILREKNRMDMVRNVINQGNSV